MLTKELCCQFLGISFYTHTEHHFPVICLDNSDREPMLQQILPKHLQLTCQQWLICSTQKSSCTGAAAPPWKNQSVLQASTEPKTHTSSSTEHRCEDGASFSKLAEGNTGAITPLLPNPQITLIQKSIQMGGKSNRAGAFRSRFKPCLILHKPFHLSKIQILQRENGKINHYCSLMDCQEIRAECTPRLSKNQWVEPMLQ